MESVNIVFAVLIMLAIVAMLKNRGLRHGHRQLRDTVARLEAANAAPVAVPAPTGATARDVERLEARLRVLERIVTDRGYDVAIQIEALRDHNAALLDDERAA